MKQKEEPVVTYVVTLQCRDQPGIVLATVFVMLTWLGNVPVWLTADG